MESYGRKSKILVDKQVIAQSSDSQKYMKIRFNSDDDLPLKKNTRIASRNNTF